VKPRTLSPRARLARARLAPRAHGPLLAVTFLAATATGVGCTTSDGAPPPRTALRPPPIAGAPLIYYRFPFTGKWYVLRTHYGAKQPDQAYALDFVPDNRRVSSDRELNSSYPCYNQPIVADGPGIVAIAVDGVPENVPPAMNNYDQHGNYVVIDHQNGEFSLMAHFIPGSLKVRAGTPVQAGMELGRCGNSGNSTLPHLHWQIMDSADAYKARGVQPRLAPYLRNGSVTSEMPDTRDSMENK
jgi:hypothetical protein